MTEIPIGVVPLVIVSVWNVYVLFFALWNPPRLSEGARRERICWDDVKQHHHVVLEENGPTLLFDQFHPMRPPFCDCFSKFALFRKRTPNLIPTHLVTHRPCPLVEPVYASHRDDVGLAPGDRDANNQRIPS